ncbi:hypothetical protein H7I76_29000, partial [Mycolicibacterium vaccae]|nr:hypothetical protein [Mycolicibacterium vaccae]
PAAVNRHGAGINRACPATPRLASTFRSRPVQPAGSETLDFRDFNVQDLLGALANSEGAFSIPDTETFDVPESGPADLGGLLNPSITAPDPGPLDVNKLRIGAALGPGNPLAPDAPATQ